MKTYKIMSQFIIVVIIASLLACGDSDMSNSQPINKPTGKGGSMARFAIVGDMLYTVNQRNISWFDISDNREPKYKSTKYISNDVETIFPYQGHLFIGSQWGMFAYTILDNGEPEYLSDLRHFFSCDPVVVQDNYAYVTLSTGSACSGASLNELQIVDISNLSELKTVANYPMENPKGLGIDGNLLFVCDNGLKVLDVSDVHNMKQLQSFDIDAYDVIPLGTVLLVIAEGGFYQYYYANNELELLSQILVKKTNEN